MQVTTFKTRSAMVAVAAAFVAAGPALAQTADSPAATTLPTVAPPAPTISAAPAEAPAATPSVAPPSAAATPAPAMATMSTPVVHQAEATASAEPEAAPRPVVKRTTHATPVRPTPAPVAVAKATPAPVKPTAAMAAPLPEKPAVADTAAPAPAPVVAKQETKATTTSQSDDTAALIGAGALGLLVLGGGAYALSGRRRRDEDEEELLLADTPVEPVGPLVTADAAPVYAAPYEVDTAPAMALGNGTLPEGFDVSRFGRHTQAAYRGPTTENPSFSLKKRLKRAAFFDRRERMAAEAGTPVPTPAQPQAKSQGEQMVFRPGRSAGYGFRPAYQS